MDIETLKQNILLKAFSLTKIPMIFACRAKIVELNDTRVRVKIPLNYFTKNHHGSMYFGAIAVGADLAGAALAVKLIRESKKNVTFIFKDFRGNFLKRPEGDVEFLCEDGEALHALVRKAIATNERENLTLKIRASVPKISDEIVADFDLTLSLKLKRPT